MTDAFGYGDILFYLSALLIAEIVCMGACLFDVRMRGFLRRHPFLFQIGVLLLTVVSLYASDSNKPGPIKPQKEQKRVYIHRGNGGGRWIPIGVNTVERVTNKVSNVEQVEDKNSDE